jgi:hypothetical protein
MQVRNRNYLAIVSSALSVSKVFFPLRRGQGTETQLILFAVRNLVKLLAAEYPVSSLWEMQMSYLVSGPTMINEYVRIFFYIYCILGRVVRAIHVEFLLWRRREGFGG